MNVGGEQMRIIPGDCLEKMEDIENEK